jgi:RIO kinase 1
MIMRYITVMYRKAGLVHADLSAFNVLLHRKTPYLIDLGQGVVLEHPQALEFLKRDIYNMVQYFGRFGITQDAQAFYDELTKPT